MQTRVGETQSTALAARAVDAVKIYGRGDAAVRALDGVTAEFPTGQFTAIMGPSRSGKSTLLHCLGCRTLKEPNTSLVPPAGIEPADTEVG